MLGLYELILISHIAPTNKPKTEPAEYAEHGFIKLE